MTHKSHSAIPFERVRGLTHIPPKSIFSRFKGKRAVRTNIAFDKSAFLQDNRKVLISCTRWRRNSSRTFRHLSIYLPVLFSRFFPLLPRFFCLFPCFSPAFFLYSPVRNPTGRSTIANGSHFPLSYESNMLFSVSFPFSLRLSVSRCLHARPCIECSTRPTADSPSFRYL